MRRRRPSLGARTVPDPQPPPRLWPGDAGAGSLRGQRRTSPGSHRSPARRERANLLTPAKPCTLLAIGRFRRDMTNCYQPSPPTNCWRRRPGFGHVPEEDRSQRSGTPVKPWSPVGRSIVPRTTGIVPPSAGAFGRDKPPGPAPPPPWGAAVGRCLTRDGSRGDYPLPSTKDPQTSLWTSRAGWWWPDARLAQSSGDSTDLVTAYLEILGTHPDLSAAGDKWLPR